MPVGAVAGGAGEASSDGDRPLPSTLRERTPTAAGSGGSTERPDRPLAVET